MTLPRELIPGVTVSPDVGFGRPCIGGTGISTAVIAARFRAGESLADLILDYNVTPGQAQAALRWELLSAYRKKRLLGPREREER